MMTLRNMRENGVRSLAITCGAVWCHHQAVLDVSAFADDLVVPSFGPRMVCMVCGAIGADARPNWMNMRREVCSAGTSRANFSNIPLPPSPPAGMVCCTGLPITHLCKPNTDLSLYAPTSASAIPL